MARDLRIPTWAELGGSRGWLLEIERQLRVMQCRSCHHRRFQGTCALLTTSRIRSPAECRLVDVPAILKLLERARFVGGLGPLNQRTGWSRAELGALVVEARNRLELARLGRDRPRIRGRRFELGLIPSERLEWLIQRHPNIELVDQLRSERKRRAGLTRIS